MKLGTFSDFLNTAAFTLAVTIGPACTDGLHPTHYDPHIRSVAIDNRLDWCEMKAQIATENHLFDPYARSGAGAVGCAQFLPSTWAWLEERYRVRLDIYSCEDSITMFGLHIRELIDEFTEMGADDPRAFAFAAYNRGEFGVKRTVREVGKGLIWALVRDYLPTETIHYVDRIRRQFKVFRS